MMNAISALSSGERRERCWTFASSNEAACAAPSRLTTFLMRYNWLTVCPVPAKNPQHSYGSSSRAWATRSSRICWGMMRSGTLNGTADRVVAVQVLDARIGTTEGAGRILGAADLAELHVKGIVNQQLICDRLTDTQDLFDGF